MKERDDRKLRDYAIIRLESLCPFPLAEIRHILGHYPNAQSPLLTSILVITFLSQYYCNFFASYVLRF